MKKDQINPESTPLSSKSSPTDPKSESTSPPPSLQPDTPVSNRSKTLRLTQLAMLSAIIIVMAFTPLGYLKVGPLSITFLTIPVVLGAVLLGPLDGAILGAVFGATSFIQCFGLDAFGTTLLTINPIYTFLLCLVPRILIGITSGYLMKGLAKVRANQTMSLSLSALAGALTNTVFFVGFLILFFGNSDYVRSIWANIFILIGALVTTNSLVEAVACMILVTILAKALVIVMKRSRR
jgi:uncharacterized membrane protein